MHLTTRNYSVFGDIYLQEQHEDVADRYLPPSDIGKVVGFLRVSLLRELMISLRGTLYIRRQRQDGDAP